MFKIKKIKTVKFLSKNLTILFVIIIICSCAKEPEETPVSIYCSMIGEKLVAFSRLSNFEKQKFQELSDTTLFIMMRESKQHPPSLEDQLWAKLHFYFLQTQT